MGTTGEHLLLRRQGWSYSPRCHKSHNRCDGASKPYTHKYKQTHTHTHNKVQVHQKRKGIPIKSQGATCSKELRTDCKHWCQMRRVYRASPDNTGATCTLLSLHGCWQVEMQQPQPHTKNRGLSPLIQWEYRMRGSPGVNRANTHWQHCPSVAGWLVVLVSEFHFTLRSVQRWKPRTIKGILIWLLSGLKQDLT